MKNLKKLEMISEKYKNNPTQKYYYHKHLFYGNIERAIKENNLSYQEIINEINGDMDIEILTKILTNEPNLTLEVMVKLADAVGLNMLVNYTKK